MTDEQVPTVSVEVGATILIGHPDNREYFKTTISLHGVPIDTDLRELSGDTRPTVSGVVKILCEKLDDVVEGNVGRRPTDEMARAGSTARATPPEKTKDAIPAKKRPSQ